MTDQQHRDRIALGDAEALFVEAGAGTGKTTALVARVVELVRRGDLLPDISHLAAITFTENAAAELRSRLRRELQQADDPRCREAAQRLDDAAVTTLHGFAQRLLGDLPLEAGLPPGFEVEDDVRAGLARDRWWASLVDDMFRDEETEQVWRVALTLELRPSLLRPVADAFAANWDLLPDGPVPAVALPPWDTEQVVHALQQVVDRWADAAPQDDALGTHLREVLRPALADLAAEPDELGRAAVLFGLKLVSKQGTKTRWARAGLDKAEVVEALEQVQALWVERLEAVKAAVLDALLHRVREGVLEDAERRRREGRLQFHDLLVRARDLLRDVPEAREALSARWRVVLVDEFQDTDPLQAELVHLLAASTAPSTWQQAVVDPGRLFFVGDPKQSIYRFRRADVQLYELVQQLVPEAGRLGLTLNFRSRPRVLRVVNAALQPLMEGAAEQVGYVDLEASRADVPDDPGPDVLLLGGPRAGYAHEVRPVEAQHVAATCRRARDEGWLVREAKAVRPVRYADIALLVPTRTSLSALEEALQQADVPYRVESRSLVWDTDVVRDLLTICEAVADPGDQVAVLTALRHPGFACSDDDLLAWRTGGGSWSPLADVPPELGDSPVAAAMSALATYHRERWWAPVNQLLERIVRERHLVELTTALPRPRDHWRRLRFVVDQARAFLDAGGVGLGDFARWARQQAERGADAVESAVPEPDDDAVRILTVHASKGLEFPVVVLTGVNVDEQQRGVVFWTPDGPEVATKGFATAGIAAAKQRDRDLMSAELVRLLYVAMTRAVDHLVVSLHHKEKTKNNHAARMHEMLDELLTVGAVHEPDAPPLPSPDAAVEALPVAEAGTHEAFRKQRQLLLDEVADRVPVSPSGLAAAAGEEPGDPLANVEPVSTPAPRRSAGGGAALGSVVHRALELVDLTAPDVDAAVELAVHEAGAPQFRQPARRRVRAALASELVQAAAGAAHWKEVPVVAQVDGRLVEGVVDLVVQRPEGLLVVDYKTDAVADDAARAAKVAHYAPQLRAYAASLAIATGLPVVEGVLLFIGEQVSTAEPLTL